MASSFTADVEAVVAATEPGDVLAYADVAEAAGRPGAARAVGQVLARSEGLPWWRVVRSDGRLAPGKEREQGRLLRTEGVAVVGSRVAFTARSTGRRAG